jgi:5'-3' exonuclease
MGIKGLNSFLKEYATKVELSDYTNKKIAIDISIYLYKFKYKATTNQFIRRFDYQLNQFNRNNIIPLYVFDGPAPIEKQQVIQKRREKNTDLVITKEDIQKLKEYFDENEVYYISAPSEAEKFCSHLNKIGKVDVNMSNDLDSLLFGCNTLLTSTKEGYYQYTLNDILEKLQITLQDLIEIGIASGCDYSPQGISGFGPSKGLKKLKKDGTIKNWTGCPENIDNLLSLFTSFTRETEVANEVVFNEICDNISLLSIGSN